MKCLICDSNNWENIDRFRIKAANMVICKECGFITYDRFKSNEDYKNFYRGSNYRSVPTFQNLTTGIRKVYYHEKFIGDIVNTFKDKNPIIGDIGAATGMFLKYCSDKLGGKGVFIGTELTESFRKVAKYEYNINLTEDFDTSKRYDLIASYKVFEHIPNLNEEMEKYMSCLKDDGYFYISVPVWFENLSLFGVEGQQTTFDGYFDPNHINVWTRNLFKNILNKFQLKIIKEDDLTYGYTVLCKKDKFERALEKENFNEILEKLDKIKKATDLLNERKLEEALAQYEDFTDGWRNIYEKNRQDIHEKGGFNYAYETLFKDMKEKCSNKGIAYLVIADVALRYDNFDKALEYANKVLEIRPNEVIALKLIANAYTSMGKITDAINTWKHIRQVSPEMLQESTNWIYQLMSKMELPK